MKDEEWIWYNKICITSIEYEYFNDKSGDRGVACSILYIQMQAKKKNVFQISQKVIKILSRLLLNSLIYSGRAPVLSLLFCYWSILILLWRPLLELSLQSVCRINPRKIHFFPHMAVSACASVSIGLESYWNIPLQIFAF